jgi:hypothetical protein
MEQSIRDQSQDEHVIYTRSRILGDKNPTSSVALLISVVDERIAVIHNKLICTSQPCSPWGSELHIYSLIVFGWNSDSDSNRFGFLIVILVF